MEVATIGVILLSLLELGIAIFILIKLTKVKKRYVVLRSTLVPRLDALELALSSVLPVLVVRIIIMEFRIYSLIFAHLIRRPRRNNQFLTRRETFKFAVIAIQLISLIEIIAIELLIPSKFVVLKIVILILTLWSLTFLSGIFLSVAKHGHFLLDDGIEIQVGFGLRGFVPFEKIDLVVEHQKELPSTNMMPFTFKEEQAAIFATSGEKCNVKVLLKDDVVFKGLVREFGSCRTLYLSLQEPRDFVMAVNKNLTALQG